jgi:hypothetical protein
MLKKGCTVIYDSGKEQMPEKEKEYFTLFITVVLTASRR